MQGQGAGPRITEKDDDGESEQTFLHDRDFFSLTKFQGKFDAMGNKIETAPKKKVLTGAELRKKKKDRMMRRKRYVFLFFFLSLFSVANFVSRGEEVFSDED